MYAFKNSILLATISGYLLLFSIHPNMIAACLYGVGVGCGGDVSLGGMIFIEFCPPSRRHYITILSVFWGLGASFAAAVALLVSSTNDTEIYDWRFIVGSLCIVATICLGFRYSMYETPAFYATNREMHKAENILNIISLENRGKEFTVEDLEKSNTLSIEMGRPEPKRDVKELIKRVFSKKLWKTSVFLGFVRDI